MPFDVGEDQQQDQREDVYQQALRAGLTGAVPARPDAAPQPVAAQPVPPALDNNLMRHAMSSGVNLSPPDSVPAMPSLPETTPAVVKTAVDKSTTMPPAPAGGIRLGELIQKRASTGQPIDRNDPKYKMGTGMKVLGTVGNFLSGFGGSKAAPTYVGPGATNARYSHDVSTQQSSLKNLDTEIADTDKLNKENESLYRDAIRQAYESQVGSARQESASAQKDAAAARQTAADATQQRADQANREITYDAKTKRFLQNGKTYLPKTVEEGASLEAGSGVEGYYTKLWKAERRNQPQQPRTPQLSAKDNLRLTAAAKQLGKTVDEMTDDEINKALYTPRTAGAKQDNAGKVSGAMKDKDSALQAQEEKFKKRWDAANKDGAEKADLDELTKEHEDRKNEILRTFTERVGVLDPDGSIQARVSQGAASAPPPQAPAAPSKPAAQPAPSAQPAPAAAKPQGAPQRKVGDVVPTKKGNLRITKILPGGKYEGVPAS